MLVVGDGRSGLVGKAFAMRLMHLGFSVYVVGETITPRLQPQDLLIVISGSGETAQPREVLRRANTVGARTLALTAARDSTIAQEADGGIYLHAGPEIGVASTKAYTSQCLALTLLALYFGRLHHGS